MKASLALVISVQLIVACNAESRLESRSESRSEPIYNGSDDTAPEHAAVVAITWGAEWGYFCSGTLITERDVLTAAHCLEEETPSEVQVYFGQDVDEDPGIWVDVADWDIHADYDGWVADIAIIHLAAAAPGGIAPIPHLPAALALTNTDEGAAVSWSGFGLTETRSEGRKLIGTGTIDSICEGPGWCAGDEIVPRAFYYTMDDGGPCTGDSGGPTFLVRGSTEYVVGVTSYGDFRCRDYGVNTTVSAYAEWIADHVEGDITGGDDVDGGVAGAADAGPLPTVDAGPAPDTGTDPGGDAGGDAGFGADDGDDAGCGCTVDSASSGPGAGALLWLLALGWCLRRRRR